MGKLRLRIPRGTWDYLPAECEKKKSVEGSMRRVFRSNGYEEIQTPALEYYDVFTQGAQPYVQENIIKFFDQQGRILALRPDSTGPIARIAATKLLRGGEVLRLCYVQSAFGFLTHGFDEKAEFTQAGVELIGKNGVDADAEVLAVAVQALLAAGLEDFKIDIGQVGYFKGLIGRCGLGEDETERIRTLVDSKNNVGLEYELERHSIGRDLKQTLLKLGGLFGGPEVLDRARRLAGENAACHAAVENVRGILEILDDFGYADYISVDFGMLNNFNYYTGITFRGVASGIGSPILSGGRYDGLVREFGADVPATGFAIGIREIMTVLEKRGGLERERERTLVLYCNERTRAAAFQKALGLRATGRSVIVEMNGCRKYDPDKFECREMKEGK